MKKFVLILFALTIFFSCTTTNKDFSKSLLGVVYDYKGDPVNSAQVKISVLDKNVEVTTDIDGKFLIPELEFGEYPVEVSAFKCSTTKTSVNHFNSQNVLIIRIHTYDDLILKFEELLFNEDLELAEILIPQIEEIDSTDIYYKYLKSIYLTETGDFNSAEAILKDLETETLGETYISLLLADLYEYHLDNKELAIKYLKKYLNREYTLKESNRLKELLDETLN